jgi:hypothetical protein
MTPWHSLVKKPIKFIIISPDVSFLHPITDLIQSVRAGKRHRSRTISSNQPAYGRGQSVSTGIISARSTCPD